MWENNQGCKFSLKPFFHVSYHVNIQVQQQECLSAETVWKCALFSPWYSLRPRVLLFRTAVNTLDFRRDQTTRCTNLSILFQHNPALRSCPLLPSGEGHFPTLRLMHHEPQKTFYNSWTLQWSFSDQRNISNFCLLLKPTTASALDVQFLFTHPPGLFTTMLLYFHLSHYLFCGCWMSSIYWLGYRCSYEMPCPCSCWDSGLLRVGD